MEPAIGSTYRGDPGSGAAGGVGWALRCLGAKYRPGAAAVLGWAKAVSKISGAGLVVTGEGRLDGQTLLGKLPTRSARLLSTQECRYGRCVGGATCPRRSVVFSSVSSACPTLSLMLRHRWPKPGRC
ncbi:glycerate kinase, partial [Paenibacillus sp. MER 180]|nr:glycerate kinase [Paenibacillus sp. MER 180]